MKLGGLTQFKTKHHTHCSYIFPDKGGAIKVTTPNSLGFISVYVEGKEVLYAKEWNIEQIINWLRL